MTVKSLRKKSTAADWPAWTDDHRYVPTEAEQREASDALNGDDWHDGEGHPDEFDRKASESQSLDQLERGLRMF